jgi:hypothetical protein
LVRALLQTGWLDRDQVHRLLVHDWAQHADKATKNALKRSELGFCTYTVPTPSVQQSNGEVKSGTLYPLPEPVPDPEAKKPSPQPRKRGAEPKHSSDPRHLACKQAIFAYYQSKNEGDDPDWDGREGKTLGMFLSANPKLTADGMKRLLEHRAASEVNHSERPSLWISKLKSYRMGPLDKFNKPLNGGSNGTGKGQPSAASERVKANRQVLAKIAIDRGWYAPASDAESDGAAVSVSGHDGCATGISEGFGETRPEILPPESRRGG